MTMMTACQLPTLFGEYKDTSSTCRTTSQSSTGPRSYVNETEAQEIDVIFFFGTPVISAAQWQSCVLFASAVQLVGVTACVGVAV